MQVKLLKDVVSSIAGSAATDIVDSLYGKKNVNEFLIAKKLDINVNQTRNILYKLSEKGLVSFIRKKDKKNGGWYTYYWTLDVGKSLENLHKVILEGISNAENQLKSRETKRFYHCEICELEMSEENALGYDFTCPECGEVLSLKDGSKLVSHLSESLNKLKEDLVIVEVELEKVHKKEFAARVRRAKLEEKKKKEKRAAARALRAKNSPKKIVKKKKLKKASKKESKKVPKKNSKRLSKKSTKKVFKPKKVVRNKKAKKKRVVNVVKRTSKKKTPKPKSKKIIRRRK